MTERVKFKQQERKRRKANHVYFTDASIAALKPRKTAYLAWDATTKEGQRGPGPARRLAVLVSPLGTKSYRCVFYYPGSSKPHWRHLGKVNEMTLEQARAKTGETQEKAKQGIDPNADDPTKSDSFKAALEDYIKHKQIGDKGNKSALETQKVMLTSCADWHVRPVASIRPNEIERLLWLVRDGDAAKGLKARPYLANRLYSHLKDFFSWCARPTGSIKTTSPMIGMRKPWGGAKPRDRVWFKGKAGDEAIRGVWTAAEKIQGLEARYLKLLLLSGKRKSTLANMRWEEIDDDWYWDAPASQVKNKRTHGVPLPVSAQRVLKPRQSQGLVFGKLDLTALQQQVRELSGISDWFPHGMRHVMETKLAELKVAPHIRDLLLDHVPARGSGAGYDHHHYKSEMREAMEVWAKHIDKVVRTPLRVVEGGRS